MASSALSAAPCFARWVNLTDLSSTRRPPSRRSPVTRAPHGTGAPQIAATASRAPLGLPAAARLPRPGPVPVRRRKPQPVPPALVRPMPEAPASAPASTAARGSLWRRRQSRVRHAGFCSFFTSSTSLSVRPDLSNHFSQHVKTHSTRFHEVYATSLQFFPENQSAACSACQFNSTGQGQIVDYGFVCNMVLYSFYSPVKHDSGGIESVVTTGVVLVGSCWILCPGLPGRQPCLVTSMASPDWVVAGSCFVVAFACVPLGRVRHVSRRTRRSLLHQKSDSVGLRVY